MTDSLLTPQQLAVVSALSSGASVTFAAREAGVHRNTIANWRRNTLAFQEALANAHYDRALYFREKMEEQADRAVEAIQQILTDPHAPASVRLRAALAVMQVAATPPEPKKRLEVEIKKVVVQDCATDVSPSNLHNSAQTAPASSEKEIPAAHNVHNSAQMPYRRESPKVGRNELCPCGSGLKFKRCCLGKPPQACDQQTGQPQAA